MGYEAVQVAECVGKKRKSQAACDHHEHEPGVHGDVVLAGQHGQLVGKGLIDGGKRNDFFIDYFWIVWKETTLK